MVTKSLQDPINDYVNHSLGLLLGVLYFLCFRFKFVKFFYVFIWGVIVLLVSAMHIKQASPEELFAINLNYGCFSFSLF